MKKKLLLYYNRISERLWFRPLLFCLFSIVFALIARQADGTRLINFVPNIEADTIDGLLNTISASMLVIAIFAVGSMISAYSSASNTATPRSFKIVIKDDVSKNALSIFIGAFIFSIVATVALDNGYYGKAGRFTLFLLILFLFATVILAFLKWVDRISRLGRLENTINQVEEMACKSLKNYLKFPHLKANPAIGDFQNGRAIYSQCVGYIQNINLDSLQELAEKYDLKIRLNCLPGKFIHENMIIAYFSTPKDVELNKIQEKINDAFSVDRTRIFDEDPRFGLISLSEIASRALSPGINDPGTAIHIIGSHIRLFFLWNKSIDKTDVKDVIYNRIEAPKISIKDFFEDAFRPICRDGADNIEVMQRLQNAFTAIETIDNYEIKIGAYEYSKISYERAKVTMKFKGDIETLQSNCLFIKNDQ